MGIVADFKDFVLRGNITDLAIGFTVGAAFTTVVKSGVEDLIMPPIGLVLGNTDFTQQFWVLAAGKDGQTEFETMAQAAEAGAITLNYGNFANNLFALFIVAVAVFALLRIVKGIHAKMEEEAGGEEKDPAEPDTKKCPYCMSTIAFKAVRCGSCTTELEGFRKRRDKPGVALHEMGAAHESPDAGHAGS